MIEANTKVMVRRLPMREMEPMEVQYNQMNNGLTKLKEMRKHGTSHDEQTINDEEDADRDDIGEHRDTRQAIYNGDAGVPQDDDDRKQIDSYSLDVKAIDKEFRCPFIDKTE